MTRHDLAKLAALLAGQAMMAGGVLGACAIGDAIERTGGNAGHGLAVLCCIAFATIGFALSLLAVNTARR